MSTRNTKSIGLALAIPAQNHTAATTITGDAVDLFSSEFYGGYPARWATLLCTGTVTAGHATIRLEHSDDGGTWETAKDQHGNDSSLELNSTLAIKATHAHNLKRYIRLVAVVTEGAEATDVTFSATVSLDMGVLSL